MTLHKLSQSENKIDGTHNLRQLISVLKSRIKDFDGQKKSNEFILENSDLYGYIQELVLKIEATNRNDKMDFARYPFTKKEGNHFYVDTFSNVEIDLENLNKRMKNIYSN